jgi:translocation and assembly module TamB
VITIPALNESVTQLKGDIQFGEHTIGIQSLEGKLAGGDVKASGQLELQDLRVRRISLTTQASQIRLRYPANFSALLNAELVVTGDQDGQQITGEVGLTRARYREEIDLTALLLRYRRRQIEPPRVAHETPQFDIRIYTTDPLRVENRMAKIDLAVDVAVRGSPNHPVILGRVEVERGTANVVGNRFTNIGGSVDFLNQTQIEPFFDIATDTQKSGYKIHATATGTPQQFDLHLTSDPPLNEEDVLRLLALGATGEALATAAGAALPGRLSSFLTGQFAEEIGHGVGSLVGVDRIEIDPVSGGKHGLAGPKVLVGKDLSRALSITYTTTFGPTRENVVSLEYRITDSISLLGIRDEKGEVGVDLKFSFRFE